MADDDKQIELRKRARRRLVGAVALALLSNRSSDGNGHRATAGGAGHPGSYSCPGRRQRRRATHRGTRKGGFSCRAGRARASGRHTAADGDLYPARQTCGCRDARTQECGARQAPARQARTRDERKARPTRPHAQRRFSRASPWPKFRPGGCASLGRFRRAVGRLSRPDQCQQPPQQTQGRRLSQLYRAGGDKTRVRVGPYPSREAAEAAMAKLKRIGLNGAVLTL